VPLRVRVPLPSLVSWVPVAPPVPLVTAPLNVVLPLPFNRSVKLEALLERAKVLESVSVPPEILLVIVRELVSVTDPLSSMLLVPVKVLLPPRVTTFAKAFAPLRLAFAEILTPLIPTALVPKAALLPRTNVPALRVVAPEYVLVPLIVAVPE